MFSQTVEYALRVVVHLAVDVSPSPRTTDQIATATRVPKAYLSKVIQGLGRANIVQSKRGIGGGVGAGEIAVRIDYSRCRQCRGTDWPHSAMSARIEDSRDSPLSAAQTHGQRLGEGRNRVSTNHAGRGLGGADQQSPVVRVAKQQEVALTGSESQGVPVMKLLRSRPSGHR